MVEETVRRRIGAAHEADERPREPAER
jgi:hypothetical protein